MPDRKRPPTKGTRYGRGRGAGEGWGGPAKGAGSGGPAHHELHEKGLQPGHKLSVGRSQPDWQSLQAAEERIAALKENLLRLALTAEREETQVSATVALLNREEGMPVQRNLMGQDKDAAPLGVVILPAKAGA